MRSMKIFVSGLVVVGLATGFAGAVSAQSITAARGPGYPVLPTDGRSVTMGGLGIGLHGLTATMVNPAAAARMTRRGALVALEVTERNVRIGDAEDELGTTRFPLIRVAFPMGGVVLTTGYGGFLDQNWGLVREGEQVLGDTTVAFSDRLISDGGVGQFQFGLAVPVGERLDLGAAVGVHLGSQRVEYSRRFEVGTEGFVDPFQEIMSWRYSGPMAQVGAQWAPADMVLVAASLTWSGTLVGDSTAGRAGRRELDLPLQIAGGASGVLVPGLMATVSGRWSGWSVTDADAIGVSSPAGPASSRDTWEVGGGLEWAPIRPAATRIFPLRAGIQYRQLPFPFAEEAPTEWFASVGGGMRVGPDPQNPLAAVDLAVQRGTRTADGAGTFGDLTERMWRFTVSVGLFGN